MREYKFRGMAHDDWYYGNLVITYDKDKNKHYYIITEDYEGDCIELGTCASPEVEANTVGQYTGLHDKKGQEIYEGDIVRFPANDEYDEVNYISYECWFDSRDTFKYGWHFSRSKFHGCLCGGNSCVSMEWARQLEVIGNVHDNKELLEG